MIATIHWKSSHPAATNKVLTIKRLPYHDTVAAFHRRRCWDACTSFALWDDCISSAFLATDRGSGEIVVMAMSDPSVAHRFPVEPNRSEMCAGSSLSL
jgi:hypothetical protein